MSIISACLEESVFGNRKFLMIEIKDFHKHYQKMIKENMIYFRKRSEKRYGSK